MTLNTYGHLFKKDDSAPAVAMGDVANEERTVIWGFPVPILSFLATGAHLSA
jgi:hypothetical protein